MHQFGHTIVEGEENISKAQALIVRSAIGLYQKTGIQANRSYTPAKMLATASRITGKKYKRGEYQKAYEDLGEYAGIAKKEPNSDAV